MLDGNGFIQTTQDTEIEQRSHLLFSLSNFAWPEVYSFGQCVASGFEAEQFAAEYHLWSQGEHGIDLVCVCQRDNRITMLNKFFCVLFDSIDLWLWIGTCSRSGPRSYRFSDRIRGYSMVQSTGNYAQLKGGECDSFLHKENISFIRRGDMLMRDFVVFPVYFCRVIQSQLISGL